MLFRLLFWLSLVAIAAACVAAAVIVARRPLKPFARNLLLALIGFELITAAAHLISLANATPPFWDWFLDLQYELNLGSIFSSLQLMVVALAALVCAVGVPGLRRWQRLYWLLLVAAFAFLSLDEFYSFHETLGGRVETEAWRIPYALAGIGLFAATAAAFWFGFRRQVRLFALLFMGLAIMAVAGIGIEEFVLRGYVRDDPSASWMYVFEELFEMVGATIILAGFISYAQENLDERRWAGARRLLLAGSIAWTGWLVFALVLQARIEAALFATPANIAYEGGLRLVAYRVSPDVVRPGGEVELTLYWEADNSLNDDYSLSVHLLSHPEIASVAQSDDLHIGPLPSRAWFPHIVVRRTAWVQLPDDLPTQQSYWLLMRAWYGPWPLGRPWQDTTGLTVIDPGTVRQLADDSVILASLPAPADAPLPPPETSGGAAFPAEGIRFEGYTLPDEAVTGDTFDVRFWWQTEAAPPRDLQQFFQLIHQDSGEVFSFDQQPFGGRFPTSDWPANTRLLDEWTVTIQGDMPAGTYDVFTGLYDLATMERAAVIGADGQPLEANSIRLGALEYAPNAGP